MQRSPLSRIRGSVLAVITVALLAFPLGVLASHQFDDVPDSYIFHNDIDALVDSGVTSGCGGNNYCPTQAVNRGQMAAFLNRLGALQEGKTPVVNAKTSQSTDGFSIGCPPSTVWSGSICIENTARDAATYFSANDTCAGLQGFLGSGWRYRLPMMGELRGARSLSGIAIDAGGEWTDAVHSEGGAYFSVVVTDGGVIDQESTISSHKFRCAAVPLSVDLNLIIIPLDERDRYPDPPQYDGGPVNEDGSPAS